MEFNGYNQNQYWINKIKSLINPIIFAANKCKLIQKYCEKIYDTKILKKKNKIVHECHLIRVL